jgi:hypothetical protein
MISSEVSGDEGRMDTDCFSFVRVDDTVSEILVVDIVCEAFILSHF